MASPVPKSEGPGAPSAKQAAEKGLFSEQSAKRHPSGAKALIPSIGVIGTTEVVPFQNNRNRAIGTTEVVPFQNNSETGFLRSQ